MVECEFVGRDWNRLTATDRTSLERATLSNAGIFYLLQKCRYPSGERQKTESMILAKGLTSVRPPSVNILDRATSDPVYSC